METKKTHLPSLAMFLTSGCGMLLALGAAVGFFIFGLLLLISSPQNSEQPFSSISFAWMSGLVAILVLPGALFALFRLLNKPFQLPGFIRRVNPNITLILWPLAIGAGFLFLKLDALLWLFLPPIEILAIGVPVLWLVSTSAHHLDGGSEGRRWKLLSFTLLITTPTIIVIELIAVGVFAFVGLSLLANQPEVARLLREITSQFSGQALDPRALETLLGQFLRVPGVLLGVIAVVCVIAPLVEEPLKSLGVWLLFRPDLTPAQGLAAGAVCGAAFTLLESLGALNNAFDGATWLVVMVGRTGTAIMHIFTASLTGWGIASLASRRKAGHTLLAYLTAMSIHAVWNFLAISSGLLPLLDASTPGYGFLSFVGRIGLYLLVLLMILIVAAILRINRNLRGIEALEVYEVK